MKNLLAILMTALVMVACKSEPPSAIVAKVKADGAGEVEQASDEALTQWMRKQGSKYAHDLQVQMCVPAEKGTPATWADTTEGRVCKAAAGVGFYYVAPRVPDTRTFTPGK